MPSVMDRQDSVVRQLVNDHVLTAEQADVVTAALHSVEAGDSRRGWWIEVTGYVGGTLTLAGAATLVGLSWEELARTGQVTLLAAIATVLVGAGLLIARGPSGLRQLQEPSAAIRRRIVSVLFALAAAVAALGTGVAVDNNPNQAAPVAGLVMAIAGYAMVRTAPGLVTVSAFAIYTLATVLEEYTSSAVAIGLAFIALGVLAMGLALTGVLVPRQLGIGFGAGIALVGAQQPTTMAANAWAYLLTAAVAVACLLLYLRERSVLLILAGVVGISIAVPEAVWDLTEGAGGAAAILLVTGAVLLATSWSGMRLHGRQRDA
jgi:hypothetical protein